MGLFLKSSLGRWIAWGVIVGFLWTTLSGCTQLRASPVRTSQLVLSSLTDPKTFNQALSQESSEVLPLISEGLITENGETGKIEPALAKEWKISPDGQEIIYTLKDNLKWSDGHPLTVDDVVFTYNDIYLNKDIPAANRDGLRVGKSGFLPTVVKVDEHRVKFSIPEPFTPFLRATGQNILPKHILESSIRTKDAKNHPQFLSTWGVNTRPLSKIVVAGPYMIESYRVGERVTLRRNPYYWRHGAKGEPQPRIERVVVAVVENTDTDLLQFRSGGIDMTDVTVDQFALLKREEKQRGFRIYNGGPSLDTLHVSFNLNQGRDRSGKPFVDPIKSKWFNTVEFRQAIAYAINRPQMLNNTYQGLGDLQHSMIGIQSPYYLSPKEGLKTYTYNPDKAKALLQKAGFTYNAQGELFDAQGHHVRFSLITNAGNKIREALGAQIQQDLARIGIQLDFNPMAFNALIEKLTNSRRWEFVLLGFRGGGVEPNSSFNIWSTDGVLHQFNLGPKPGEPAIPNWQVSDWEKQISDLYIQGAQALDESKRKEIYAKAQQLVQEYVPFIYLITPLSFSGVQDRVQNVKYSALGGSMWNIHELTLHSK
ncbi:MAG TPA: ABC transporter substrate-binding protein [Stenomitos sp.]